MTTRRLYLHIGAGKTGTSALQAGLRGSVDGLLERGVGLPLVDRREYAQRVLRPMGWVIGTGFVHPPDVPAVRKLVRKLKRAPGDRLLLSNEDLCELDPPRIQLLMEVAEAADLDVEVIVTARDWSKQLPSEYQQFLKHRLRLEYLTFLECVRDQEGPAAAHYWLRQDFAGICRRWGAAVDAGKVHVISVPPMSLDPEGVFRLFGEAVGFDATILRKPQKAVNTSFGYAEAEVLRRVNVALGTRLPDYETDYVPVVRNVLIRKVLAREKSARLTVPPEHISWVRQLDQQRVAQLTEAGHRIHGDPELLIAPLEAARPLPVLDEAEVAAAAIETLTDFAVNMSLRWQSTRAGNGREGA